MSLFKTTPTLRAIALTGLLGAASLGAMAQAEKPQYGGTLNIGMVYVTLSPLSWDPADWAWKFGQDTGAVNWPRVGKPWTTPFASKSNCERA